MLEVPKEVLFLAISDPGGEMRIKNQNRKKVFLEKKVLHDLHSRVKTHLLLFGSFAGKDLGSNGPLKSGSGI